MRKRRARFCSSDVFYSLRESEEERVSLISVTLELIYLTRDKRCFMAYDGNVVFILEDLTHSIHSRRENRKRDFMVIENTLMH